MLRNDKDGSQLDRTQPRSPTPLMKHAKHATGIPLHSLNQSCPRLRLRVPDASAHDRPQTADNSRGDCPHPREGFPHRFSLHWLPVRFRRPTPRPSGGSRQRNSDRRQRRALEKFGARSIAVEKPSYILPPADGLPSSPRNRFARPNDADFKKVATVNRRPSLPSTACVPSQVVAAPKSKKPALLRDAPFCPDWHARPPCAPQPENRKSHHC